MNHYHHHSVIRAEMQDLLLRLDHDDMIAKLGFDRRVCVHRGGWRGAGESKRCFLEGPHHRAAAHPAQVTTRAGLVLAEPSGHLVEPLSVPQGLQSLHRARVFFAENMAYLQNSSHTHTQIKSEIEGCIDFIITH